MDRPPDEPDRSDPRDQARVDDDDLEAAERAATHRVTEDVAPGVLKDGHGEIQPDPYPDRPDAAGSAGKDRSVIAEHREEAKALEQHRTGAANETLGTVADAEEREDDRGDRL